LSKEEYHLVLFNLGLLDDEEDWELYHLQESRFDYEDYIVEYVGYPLYNYSLKRKAND